MILFNKPYCSGHELKYMAEVCKSTTMSGNGTYTKLCHKFFEERYGFRKCLLTTSCTDALEMAAGGLGLDDFLEGFLGDPSDLEYFCPECGQKLLLYDWWHNYGVVYICGNQNCAACREQWLFYTSGGELRRLSE